MGRTVNDTSFFRFLGQWILFWCYFNDLRSDFAILPKIICNISYFYTNYLNVSMNMILVLFQWLEVKFWSYWFFIFFILLFLYKLLKWVWIMNETLFVVLWAGEYDSGVILVIWGQHLALYPEMHNCYLLK